ncbi:MAG: ABC transporter ATP-binding protein [Thermoflexales bacterium]|nr:ABC transporter ATP-binding protein [Thermoflexales bacterium]
MSRVSLQGVAKSFGSVQAVKDVTLDIPDHAFVTLLGPSGCGKTTTLNMLAGLERVSRGKILLDGQEITDWAPHERGMAMVFQNYALYPHMDVYGNIAFSLKLKKTPKAEIEQRVQRVAKALEVDKLLQRRISQLSGGQQQRVALARAMVKEPKVFLFDEPLSNLDAALRTRMRIEIKKLHQQLKATSIFVTHDQEEAMILSDYIAVMKDGVVMQYGKANDVYRRPNHLYVGTFIGKPRMSILEGELRVSAEGGEAVFEGEDLRLAWPGSAGTTNEGVAGAVSLGVRAEDAHLVPAQDAGPDTLVGDIALLEPLGSDTFVEVVRGRHSITARVEPDAAVFLGDRVGVRINRAKLHVFDRESGLRLAV